MVKLNMTATEIAEGVRDWLDDLPVADRGKIALSDPEDDIEIEGEGKRDIDSSDEPQPGDYFFTRVPLEALPEEYRYRKWVHPPQVSHFHVFCFSFFGSLFSRNCLCSGVFLSRPMGCIQ